ncbi:unnamed protein product [Amoebophrya sp. A25]|nr:unnamed protein product [Amoebophrya sp. A25]|eukprot:GSA25T00018380001.1
MLAPRLSGRFLPFWFRLLSLLLSLLCCFGTTCRPFFPFVSSLGALSSSLACPLGAFSSFFPLRGPGAAPRRSFFFSFLHFGGCLRFLSFPGFFGLFRWALRWAPLRSLSVVLLFFSLSFPSGFAFPLLLLFFVLSRVFFLLLFYFLAAGGPSIFLHSSHHAAGLSACQLRALSL